MRDLGINSRLGYCFQCRLDKLCFMVEWGPTSERGKGEQDVSSEVVWYVRYRQERKNKNRGGAKRPDAPTGEGKGIYVYGSGGDNQADTRISVTSGAACVKRS